MKTYKEKTTTITFRIPVSSVEKLDTLCQISKLKRSDFLISCIELEYDRVNGYPEVKKLLKQMTDLNEELFKFKVTVEP